MTCPASRRPRAWKSPACPGAGTAHRRSSGTAAGRRSGGRRCAQLPASLGESVAPARSPPPGSLSDGCVNSISSSESGPSRGCSTIAGRERAFTSRRRPSPRTTPSMSSGVCRPRISRGHRAAASNPASFQVGNTSRGRSKYCPNPRPASRQQASVRSQALLASRGPSWLRSVTGPTNECCVCCSIVSACCSCCWFPGRRIPVRATPSPCPQQHRIRRTPAGLPGRRRITSTLRVMPSRTLTAPPGTLHAARLVA